MHMQVRHRLPGNSAVIDADVVALWLQLGVQHPLGTVKQGQQVGTLLLREIEKEPVCRLGISKVWPGTQGTRRE